LAGLRRQRSGRQRTRTTVGRPHRESARLEATCAEEDIIADDERTDQTPEEAPQESQVSKLTTFRHGLVRGIAIAALALFVAFALANSQAVDFHWLFGQNEVQTSGGDRTGGGVPLILLLLGAFLLGLIVGASGLALRQRRKRSDDR
jgi:uncharacterized integral membrane protein